MFFYLLKRERDFANVSDRSLFPNVKRSQTFMERSCKRSRTPRNVLEQIEENVHAHVSKSKETLHDMTIRNTFKTEFKTKDHLPFFNII